MKTLISLAFFVLAVAAYEEFRGDQVIRIEPKSVAHLVILKKYIQSNNDLDVWKEPSAPGHVVDIHMPKGKISSFEKLLTAHGISYNIMVPDVEDLLNEEELSNMKNSFYSSFDYNKYNRWSDIKMELQNLARSNRGIVSLFQVGRTYEGETMIGLKVTNGDGRSKPVVWIDGGIHAREWISPATVMYFMNKMITQQRSDNRVAQALAKYDFYFMPVFNIDGYKYTHTGRRARFWRKTRKPYGWYCYGADPNRNWDSHWETGVGTSSNCQSDVYRGPQPASEVEVQNVQRYLGALNLKSYWNVHAYSQLVLTPWSWTTTLPRDYSEIKRVGDVFANAVSRRYGTQYKVGPPSRILYAVSGGSIDYTYEKLDVVYSYALELRDTGRYGFVLPANQIQPSGEETSDAFLAAVLAMK
ncbi:carboxypeptidase B-like [Clytia hemisphaerica]|uniref:Peptidase M14 domain-containing protein n=1 Tax=Clytia hemisphaerica TaxID=252671 RepID=A0A7M5XDT5_9CNID